MLVFHCGAVENACQFASGQLYVRTIYASLFRHLSMIFAISKHSSSLIVVVKT
jgi:hypothetical protein